MREHLLRDAEIAQRQRACLAQRRQRQRELQRPLRQRVGDAFVDAHGEARRVRVRGQLVDHILDALPARVGEVERPAVEVGLVRDVLERAGDPVDGHDVRVAEIQSDERHPLGQQLAQPLDRLEEVVRAVDLVHLAGLRVADHDARPVHAPRHVGLLAHDPLGLVLGAVIRRGQALALVEHVLVEDAPVGARDGDRGHVVQALGVDRARQLDGVRGAADVDRRVALGGGRHVIDGRQVEEMVDLAAQLRDALLLDAQQRAAQIADHRLDALRRRGPGDDAPARDQVVEPRGRAVAHEHVHLALAQLEQLLHQTATDEARRSCHEVRHCLAEHTLRRELVAGTLARVRLCRRVGLLQVAHKCARTVTTLCTQRYNRCMAIDL